MKVSIGPGEIVMKNKGWMTSTTMATNGGGKVTQMRRTDAGWIMPILIVFSLITLVTSLVFFFEGPHPQFSLNVFKDLVARIVHIGPPPPFSSEQDSPSNHIVDPAQYENKLGVINAMVSVDAGGNKPVSTPYVVGGVADVEEEEEDTYGRGRLRKWSKKPPMKMPYESPLFEQEEEEVEVNQDHEQDSKKEEEAFDSSKQFPITATIAHEQHQHQQQQTTKQKKRLEKLLDQFDSFVDGKEFIVFQVDNRALPIMLRGEPYAKSSFNVSAFGPSALSLSRWARQHNYAYIMNLSQLPFPDPYKRRTMTFFWQKIPPYIILMRLAILSNKRKLHMLQQQQQQQDVTTKSNRLIKGIVFADTDVFPHEYLPKWLSANLQSRWYKDNLQQQQSPTNQGDLKGQSSTSSSSTCTPRIVSFKEDAMMSVMNANNQQPSHDTKKKPPQNSFVDLDEFLDAMPKPLAHIYIAKGHSSSEGWLRNGIKYPSSVWVPVDSINAATSSSSDLADAGINNRNHNQTLKSEVNRLLKEIQIPSVNGGMFLARPTETALELLREWYLQSSRRTSLEMNTVKFTVKTNRSTSSTASSMSEIVSNTLVDVGDNVLANSNTHQSEMEVLVKVLRWMRSVRKENEKSYLLNHRPQETFDEVETVSSGPTTNDTNTESSKSTTTSLLANIKTQQQVLSLRESMILDETMIDLVDERVCTPFAIRERRMLSTSNGDLLPTFSLMCRGVDLEVINKHFNYFCDKRVDERIDCFKRTFRNFLNVWPAEQGKIQWLILRSIARGEGNSVFYLSNSPALSTPDQFFPNRKQSPSRKTRVFYHVATASGMKETSLAVSRILMQETHPDQCILNAVHWEKEAWDLFRKLPAFKLSFKKSFVEIERQLFGLASSSSSSSSSDDDDDDDDDEDDKLLEMFNI